MDVSAEDAAIFLEEFKSLLADIDGFGIFTHNTTLAIPMFIPGVGAVWGMFSAWSTGLAFSAFTVINPELENIPALSILYLSPFGMMELAAYSLGTSRSYILIRVLMKKLPFIPHLKSTAMEMGAVVGLLLVGGYLEYYLIELAQDAEFELLGS